MKIRKEEYRSAMKKCYTNYEIFKYRIIPYGTGNLKLVLGKLISKKWS